MRPGTVSLLAACVSLTIAAGCGDDQAAQVDVAGTWSYDWQVRETGEGFEGWDGHFRGQLVLEQHGVDVMGTLGYPVIGPAELYGDPALRDAWQWQVYGVLVGAELHLFAPPPNTAWDDGWKWHLVVSGDAMAGPSWAGAALVEKWPFSAQRGGT